MTDNVVTLYNPRQEEWARSFTSMEGEVFDLVRAVDLALHVWLTELDGEKITDDGSALQIILEDIVYRAKKLRARYRPDRDGADDPAA